MSAAPAGQPPKAATQSAAQTRASYYDQPIIKSPVWTPEIPWYLFAGGLGGASASLAFVAERAGRRTLAKRAWLAALAGVSASPALLVSDLGVPSRFFNMLRMFKVTSPMSVGSWILASCGASTGVAALHELTGSFGGASQVAKPAAGILGLPLATYTGALISQTAVPAWHEARRELPTLFAGGAAASAGAAVTALTPTRDAGPARRLALIGSAVEIVASEAMEHRLGELAEPYSAEAAGAYSHAARALTVSGALLLAARADRSRGAAVAGSALVLAGAVCERWAVFKAGFQSARDPRYTVEMQRRRVSSGRTRGASRRVEAGGPDNEADSPGAEADSPSFEPGSPDVEAGSPSFEPGGPGVEADSPGAEADSPSFEPGSPGVEADSPGAGAGS